MCVSKNYLMITLLKMFLSILHNTQKNINDYVPANKTFKTSKDRQRLGIGVSILPTYFNMVLPNGWNTTPH